VSAVSSAVQLPTGLLKARLPWQALLPRADRQRQATHACRCRRQQRLRWRSPERRCCVLSWPACAAGPAAGLPRRRRCLMLWLRRRCRPPVAVCALAAAARSMAPAGMSGWFQVGGRPLQPVTGRLVPLRASARGSKQVRGWVRAGRRTVAPLHFAPCATRGEGVSALRLLCLGAAAAPAPSAAESGK
jgi:hypothetical protein